MSTEPKRGRGAGYNPHNRFESTRLDPFDDGWHQEPESQVIGTTILEDTSKGILASNKSPDVPFDWSINAYRGCEHGCVYCYARPSHAYWGLSPGLDFETQIFAKRNADELLKQEFEKKGYQARVIALGTNTDPYQPIEREEKITRRILELMQEYCHPVTITTKSAGILRDIDLLKEMAQHNLASVALSITTLDPKLARKMEPRAASPARRLDAIQQLADAGIPTAVMVAPVIPALTDWELERILEASANAGAAYASYILLRLPLEVASIFDDWLKRNVPDKQDHVMSLMRQLRGGSIYNAQFKQRMKGSGPLADILARRFELAIQQHQLNRIRVTLDTLQFRRPHKHGDQLSLF